MANGINSEAFINDSHNPTERLIAIHDKLHTMKMCANREFTGKTIDWNRERFETVAREVLPELKWLIETLEDAPTRAPEDFIREEQEANHLSPSPT